VHAPKTSKQDQIAAAEKVQGWIDRARGGDFDAYLNLNGFTRSTTKEKPTRLMVVPHVRLHVDRNESHLKCKYCGHWHGQDTTPRITDLSLLEPTPAALNLGISEVVVGGDGAVHAEVAGQNTDGTPRFRLAVPPATCPHCGSTNCAGPHCHFDQEFRGAGKTEMTELEIAYNISLMRIRGHKAEVMIVGANEAEGKKRLSLLAQVMLRDGHQICFPEVRPITKKTGVGKALRFEGDAEACVYAYGIEGIPPGFHGDLIWLDDVCNQTNTMMRPGLMAKIIVKYDNVIEYSQQPWTIVYWTGTPWRVGDLDEKVDRYAETHQDEWTWHKLCCGGPEPVLNSDGSVLRQAFESPWPEKWPSSKLARLYEKDQLAYRRAMMLQRIADSDVIFHNIRLWVSIKDKNLDKAPPELMRGVPILDIYTDAETQPSWKEEVGKVITLFRRQKNWEAFIGLDTAYTGEAAVDKKGRSKTGVCVGLMDPKTKWVFILYSWEGWIAPGGHVAAVLPLCERYGTKTVIMEIGGALAESVERFTTAGFFVETYNLRDKAYGGSKTLRKIPVASDFNEGRAFLAGRLVFSSDGAGEDKNPRWQILPVEHHKELLDAMYLFPSRQSDRLDALEIVVRSFRRFFGLTPKKSSCQEEDDALDHPRRRMKRFRVPPPKKPKDVLSADVTAMCGNMGKTVRALGIV
jgi:hypothetical protein